MVDFVSATLTGGTPISNKDYFEKQRGQMKTERSSFDGQYRSLAQFIQPRRGRFFTQDRNKGDRRWNSIINNHATWALQVARAGMQAGVMSQARPWFKIETFDPGLMEFEPVKIWLETVEGIIRDIFNASNLYTMAPVMLGELLNFGTGCMTHVDDFENIARFYTHTVGSYYIAQNEKLEVDTLCREYEMTTKQMVGEFGLDNVSQRVKTSWDKGDYTQWFPVVHYTEPNPDHDPGNPLTRFKKWRSVKYEMQRVGETLEDKFLSWKGFDRFPAYCPRWELTGEDIYGTNCPAMSSLGDIKQLQTQEKRKGQAIDKSVNPPLKGPAELKNKPVSSLPGGLTIYSNTGPGDGLSPIYLIQPNLGEMKDDMEGVKERISRGFYIDLFLAITQMQGIQPRNVQELVERNQERLIQLGPVLERVHGEFLEGVVENTFAQAAEADILPPAPEELQGAPIKIKFISSLALAQRSIATGGIERLTGYVGGLVQTGFESAADKFNADAAIEQYADAIGAPAELIVPDDQVLQVRQARAELQEQQAQAAALQQAATTAQMAGNTPTDEKNLLTDVNDTIKEATGRS